MNQHPIMIMAAMAATIAVGEPVKVDVDTATVKKELPPTLYGAGMEDVNHEIYGGLDAQRLYGESFEEPTRGDRCNGVSSRWFKCEERDGGEFRYDQNVFHQGKASQVLDPQGGICAIANQGLGNWGVPARAGKPMIGHIFTLGHVDRLEVGLQDRDGRVTYATAELMTVDDTNRWQRAEFKLTPDATDVKARFFIRALGNGKVWLDDVYLADEPTNEFGRLGCREDIVAAFQRQQLTFLRWGGTMVNTKEYRLANMNGKGERRPYRGHWFGHSSGGFGPYEFVRMANAMKLPCALSINCDETIEDAVAFAKWLKQIEVQVYVQIGNEEGIPSFKGDTIEFVNYYIANVRRLVTAMRQENPKLKFVSAYWWNGKHPDFMEASIRGCNGYIDYLDVHVGNARIEHARGNVYTLKKVWQIVRSCNPTTMKLAIFEENGRNHSLERGLSHAITMAGVREFGQDILTCCGANALQPYLQNDNWWNQGMIYFTPDQTWMQPYGWAKQMGAANHRELLIKSAIADQKLVLSATMAKDRRSVVLHLVNPTLETKRLAIAGLDDYRLAKATVLTAKNLRADNPVEDQNAVVPRDVTADFAKNTSIAGYAYLVLVYER